MSDVPLIIAILMGIGVSIYAKGLSERLDKAEDFIVRAERIRKRCREMNNSPASREWAYDELLWLLDFHEERRG